MTLNAGVIANRSNTTDNNVPSFSIAGKRPDSNRFTMNGMDYVGNNAGGTYTAPQGISGFLLGVDAVREFNVLGHTYGAEYGKRAGAQVTIVTTSGTNQWRGSVFEYLRNMTDPFVGKTPLIENHAKALWQPRVGLAWDVTGSGKWAVRAGFGIHNDLQDNLANRLNANPPFSGRLTFLNQPLLSIIPVSAEVAPPPACKFVGQTNPPCSVYAPGGIDPVLRTPTLQQWSLTVEHQLAQDLVAEVEYVGSQSYHVSTTMDVNTIQPLKCDNPAGCLAGGILAARAPSPQDPCGIPCRVPQGTEYVPWGAAAPNTRPNPLLGTSQGWYYLGTSNYHAMNLSLLKRATRGLTFKTSYTWGKVLDLNSANLVNGADNEAPTVLNRFDRRRDKGPASFSLLHQFSTNFSYQLPFGNGKTFGGGATGWVDKLIGGWQWNGIFVANSGLPITPQGCSNRAGTGGTRRLSG